MNKRTIYCQAGVIVAGLVFTLSGCNGSKTNQRESTTQSVSIDSTYEDVAIPEVVDNASDVYFEQAVAALRKRDNKQAARELTAGLAAFVEEAQMSRVAPLSTLHEQLTKMEALVPEIEAGTATPDRVAFTTGVGELLVAHDRIEKIESIPVFSAKINVHLRQVLKNIEHNSAHLSQKAKQDGVAAISDARRALDDFDKATVKDTQKATQHVRNELVKVKSFIEKNT